MDKESFDFKKTPPSGVFYNRMSASAHSRGHRYAPENTKDVLGWWEKDKKRVVNNSRALELEISKKEQYKELKKFNINYPETYYAKDKKEILVDCMWDNPNYWYRYVLVRNALKLHSSKEYALFGEYSLKIEKLICNIFQFNSLGSLYHQSKYI